MPLTTDMTARSALGFMRFRSVKTACTICLGTIGGGAKRRHRK